MKRRGKSGEGMKRRRKIGGKDRERKGGNDEAIPGENEEYRERVNGEGMEIRRKRRKG